MDKETLGRIAGIGGVIIMFALITVIAWVVLGARQFFLTRANRGLQTAITRYHASKEERPGYVRVKFPVYVGGSVALTEITTEVWVPRAEAKGFINALALLSMKYGLYTILFPHTLVMVGINYMTHASEL